MLLSKFSLLLNPKFQLCGMVATYKMLEHKLHICPLENVTCTGKRKVGICKIDVFPVFLKEKLFRKPKLKFAISWTT